MTGPEPQSIQEVIDAFDNALHGEAQDGGSTQITVNGPTLNEALAEWSSPDAERAPPNR